MCVSNSGTIFLPPLAAVISLLFPRRFPFPLRGEGAGPPDQRVRLPYSLGVCWCCWVGAATAPVATLLSLHPDRDIIASRVSAALLRAHTAAAAVGTAAAAARTACSTTHPSTKSGIRSNSRVIPSDAHFEIKKKTLVFVIFLPPSGARVWPVSTASPLINCLDVYGRDSL